MKEDRFQVKSILFCQQNSKEERKPKVKSLSNSIIRFIDEKCDDN